MTEKMLDRAILQKYLAVRRAIRANKHRKVFGQSSKVLELLKTAIANNKSKVLITAEDLGVSAFAPSTYYRPLIKVGLLVKVKGHKHRQKVGLPIAPVFDPRNKNRVREVIIPLPLTKRK